MKNVNNEIYDTYGERWYTADDDPVALLRAESKAKLPWVIQKIEKHFSHLSDLKVLDVGCGAGFLSNALATRGLNVTGADLSEESLRVAKLYDSTKTVQYITADAYHLPFSDQSFDVLTAMDFLEHVEDPKKVVQEFARVLKPGGLFIFHTFNRNWLAYIVIIKFVEWFVANTPKHLHILRLFIKPSELEFYCESAQLHVEDWTGVRPVLSSIPLRNLFTGLVPRTLQFQLTPSLLLSYMGCATKNSKTT